MIYFSFYLQFFCKTLHKLPIYLIYCLFIFSMFNRVISDPQQIPIPESQRRSTDVCCTLIAAILAITLFLIAVTHFDKDITKAIYFSSLGQDGAALTLGDYHGFKATLFYAVIMTFSLGLIWITLIQLLPQRAPFIAYIMAILGCLAIGILAILGGQTRLLGESWLLRISLCILGGFAALALIMSLCLHEQQLQFQGIMLKYAVRYLFEQPKNFLCILLFLILLAGLLVIFLFQHLCFSNIAHQNNNFFNFANPGLLGILNILEFLWGLQFLRDAYTFILAGNAVQWYWGEQENEGASIDRLLCKNWGSVAAGSFMNAFLGLPSTILQIVICHLGGYCGRCGYCCKNTFYGIFSLIGLIRTDSYSYINIFGIPYCDAGVECEKLCNQSQHFLGFQSAMRNFRAVACVVLLIFGILLSFLILGFRVSSPNIWFAIDLGVLVLGIGSFFASIHPNVAEGIQTSFLVQSYLASSYQYMQKCIPSFRKELQALSKKSKNQVHQL